MTQSLNDSSCVLCGDIPHRFYEDDVATAALSGELACRGHSVLVSRRHVENVSDLSGEEAVRFFTAYRLVERALLDLFELDRVLAVKLGLAVPHLHIHLYPVSRNVTRDEVDAILAREVRMEPSEAELSDWLEELRHRVSDPTR